MPAFCYHRPATVEEAVGLLAERGPDAKVLAGGQSLVPLLALRLSHPAHLVDIGRVAGLDTVDDGPGGFTVGAGVRHSQVELSPVTARVAPLVAAAMPHIGHRAIRNRGTVCGSLAHADPAAELPAVALAVDAELIVRSSAGERTIPAADFFLGYLTSALDDTELLTAVRFPPWPPSTGWSVAEISRRHGDYALVGLAAVVGLGEGGRVQRAALSFLGAGATPVRVTEAERVLVGEHPDPEAFAEAADVVTKTIEPPGDNHATAAYRAHVAGVLTRRCLAEAAERARAGSGAGGSA
ncbi:MAG TPA: xanthine dehydrogenase family protein subunit M [Acidimicrobiia bacterium]|nr:xanthine dehydrogenase family protein subunit M [Acidimicrobiia bacterium]